MSLRVAIVGPGGVGGTLAVRLAVAGCDVTCVTRAENVGPLRRSGLELRTAGGESLRAAPLVSDGLASAADVVFVTVKAPALPDALARIEPSAVVDGVVVPLLNGLEHPAAIRDALGPRVAPGSISRFEAHVGAPGRIEQRTPSGIVTLASDDVPRDRLEAVADCVRRAGLDAKVADDERAVLWDKVARLAVLAAATVASGLAVGELREPPWRERLEVALEETCRVSAAAGAHVAPAGQWEIIDAMDPSLTTSTARDVAAGRPSELDAICGSVFRAAARVGVDCPELAALAAEAEERAG